MQALLHHSPILRSHRCSSSSVSTMASSLSLTLPSISINKLPSTCSSNSFCPNGLRSFSLDRSRVSMNASVGPQTVVNEALFSDYKPTSAFLFPGQVQFVNCIFFGFMGNHIVPRCWKLFLESESFQFGLVMGSFGFCCCGVMCLISD